MNRRGRYTCVDPRNPRAAAVCDRGGEVVRHSELRREMRWAGNRLVPTGFLCCARHLDPPHPQDRVLILRPDPVPISNPRPFIDMPAPANAPGRLGNGPVPFILGRSALGTPPPAGPDRPV